ncbi:MAG: serine/threonine protein phosphatase, partial [Cycloclasticus sp.]|nr:serine/threonine protein phosphatase [Cycloclasticus sp.]
YKMSEISAAFTSNFDDLVTQPDLWVYGHTHSNLDIKVGNCRLVSNQQGYPNEEIPIPFRSDWVIEV